MLDKYGFYTGKIFDAYEHMGAHIKENGTEFSTFAPAAQKIAVIGEFNGWTETWMERENDRNFFRCFIEGATKGMKYKYRIYKRDGQFIDHCDPYGFGMELRPHNASIIRDLSEYKFNDEKWLKERTDCKKEGLNIYEFHMGSWKHNVENENGWFSYREMADQLIDYVKDFGYNYIEVMPLSEHPSDESWGYQNTGFFSPTSRYGTAADLMEFVDKCHQNNIGVIMDIVPVHFAIDDYALANYDGTALYEYPHTDVGVSEWGSKNFIHSRGEVQSFLQSAANYWIKEYHFDGLRMDAISNIIYWQGDTARGVNQNAVEFVKRMNQKLKEEYPSIILSAEDSSSFPGVTKKVEEGGLGFDYKWDMGWMNDTLDYFKKSPAQRIEQYHKLTFSMMYFYNEKFLLPLSHDEVVHGKGTIIDKMYGEYEEKFPQAKSMYMYMMAHPGKKLNFMGNELAHFREWDEKKELDWNLLTYPKHQQFHDFMKCLNNIYMENKAFWDDYDESGFEWLDCHQEEKCVYIIKRTYQKQNIIAAFNFSDQDYSTFKLKIPGNCNFKLLLSSEMNQFGGSKEYDLDKVYKARGGWATLELPKFSAQYYIVNERNITQ